MKKLKTPPIAPPDPRHDFEHAGCGPGWVHYKCKRCNHIWSPTLDYRASPVCMAPVRP